MALVLVLRRRTTRHVRPSEHVVFNGEIQSKEQVLGTYGWLLLETRNSRPRIHRDNATKALNYRGVELIDLIAASKTSLSWENCL